MPYLVTTMWYPTHANDDIVKRYIKITKNYPARDELYIQLCAPLMVSKEGIKVMTIREPKKGKFEETMTYTTKFLNEFLDIEGYTYQIDVWHTFQEALAIGDIEVPD